MTYLYSGKILQVNLSEGKVSKEPTSSYADDFLGGRGINIKILYDGVPPEVAPLDPDNILIFGVGPLCGTPLPTSRVEVTTKSPETGFLGSTSFGGYFGPELKFAGYDNIVINGKANKPVYLWIYNDYVQIRDASHLWGKDSFQTQEIIRSEVNPDAKVVCIGQAGENQVRFATVQSELKHGGGRTGIGCVMGSKNLKAIVVRGTNGVALADSDRYLSITNELQNELRSFAPVIDRQRHGMALQRERPDMIATRGQVPRQAFTYDLVLKHKPKRTGCFGCPTQCMDLYPPQAKGGGALSCTLYVAPFFDVRNTDTEVLLECSTRASRYGVDIVSSMHIIAWLMELYEKGIITSKDIDGISMEWGSCESILGMLEKIVHRDGFGDVLADGMVPAARRFGHKAEDCANQMKGLPLYTAWIPEELVPLKGFSLAMAVDSRGDNMRSMPLGLERHFTTILALACKEIYGEKAALEFIRATQQKVKEITGTAKAFEDDEYQGKPELIVYTEDRVIVCDSLGACKISSPIWNYPFSEKYQANLLSAGIGMEISIDDLLEFARRVKNCERAYNAREGMTRDMDSLPKRFMDRQITYNMLDCQDINNLHYVKKRSILESSRFEQMKDKYYALRRWDIDTGIPTCETLEQTGLGGVVVDLKKRGKLPDQKEK